MRTSHTISNLAAPSLAHAAVSVAAKLEALLVRALLWPVRFYRGRRELAQLAAMNERELRDIGLNRSDLANVTALPGDADPTAVLAKVVHDRQHWRRA